MKNNILRKLILIASIVVYLFALTQKSFCTTASCGDSIMALISGTIGFLLGGAALTWLANPLLFASWIFIIKFPKRALIISLLSTLVIISFLFFKKIIADEAGSYKEIIAYRAGYWLWLSSSLIMLFGSMVSLLFNSQVTTEALSISYDSNRV